MKKFRFKYSPLVWVLIGLVIVIFALGFIWNVFNLAKGNLSNTFNIVSYSFLSLITLILTVFAISLLVYGKYVIKRGYLYTYFGFIRSKIEIKDIVCITLFRKSNKLVIYLKDQCYSVIVISPDCYNDFVLSLREQNKEIYYDTKIEGED